MNQLSMTLNIQISAHSPEPSMHVIWLMIQHIIVIVYQLLPSKFQIDSFSIWHSRAFLRFIRILLQVRALPHLSSHSFLTAISCHYLSPTLKFSAQSEHFLLASHDQDLALPQLHSITQFHQTLLPFIEIVYDNVWVKFQVIPFNIHWAIQETLQIHSICSQNCAVSSGISVTHYSQTTKDHNIVRTIVWWTGATLSRYRESIVFIVSACGRHSGCH